MQRYLVRSMVLIIPTLLGVTVAVFLMLQLVPGDPALILLGQEADPELLARLREQMGLNDPVWVRYGRWVAGVVRGDFGDSVIDRMPVLPAILSRLPATLTLLFTGMLLSLAIGIPSGVVSAVYPNKIPDFLFRFAALIGLCIPSFWLALLLILLFSYHFRVLPTGGYGDWQHLILPTITLGSVMAALIMRITRSVMLNVLQEDYIRTARGKGLAEKTVLYGHALRNAMLPLITIIGLNIGNLLGGTVIIEAIFDWPGIGKYAYLKMTQRDYPAIMANLFLFAFLFIVINLLTDLAYKFFDPRITYE